jgi:hypothetical protein
MPRTAWMSAPCCWTDKAPANAAFLWAWAFEAPRVVPAIHAMWTGPEISCPIPPSPACGRRVGARPLPPENATLHPQPGDVVLAYVPPRMWGGNPDAIFDIGLFYGAGRADVLPHRLAGGLGRGAGRGRGDRAALAEACGRIRRGGATDDHLCEGRMTDDSFRTLRPSGRDRGPRGRPIYCGKPGDWFELRGEQLHLPPGQSFLDLLAGRRPAAACRPSSA